MEKYGECQRKKLHYGPGERQEAAMEVAELKMSRFSLGVTRMDKNE